MRRSMWIRVLSVMLILCMLATPVSAATLGRSSSGSGTTTSWFQDLWNRLINRVKPGETTLPTEPVETEPAETEPAETEPAETEGSDNTTMTVIEDASTVENSSALRASTYALTSTADDGISTAAETTTVVYYPVTMYNYDADTINAATHQAEVDAALAAGTTLTAWNGLYFNNGDPGTASYSYTTKAGAHTNLTWAQVSNGTYYSDEACTIRASVEEVTKITQEVNYSEVTVTYSNLWSNGGGNSNNTWYETGYYYLNGNTYEMVYIRRSNSGGGGGGGSSYKYTASYGSSNTTIGNTNQNGSASITVYEKSDSKEEVTGYNLTAGGSTLATLSGTDTTAQVGVTLYSKASTASTGTLPYAPHNAWTNKIFDADDSTDYDFGKLGIRTSNVGNQVGSGSSSRAGYIYKGLVENTLDANKNIVFVSPEGGIFNDDATVKDIYTNVGLPFQKDGFTYTFDSKTLSAKFDGTPASNTNLVSSSDGEFWPFGTSDKWHFGMNATIPFTMTLDGTLKHTDGTVEDIVFEFAGDDDVWVFIDGVLVLDIGGIHNSVSGTINFADNETTVYSTDTSIPSGYLTTTDGAVKGEITGALFNEYDDNGNLTKQGVLNQTLETFAATDNHELTVFYLERGQGVSNCKISFNLPVKDTLSVQKIVDKAADFDANGNLVEYDLTAEQKAVIDNMDFGFTLYDGSNNPVANETYVLLNANGQIVATPSTDASGHFTLKNGQTAKFVGDFDNTNGDTYYVVEDIKNGFIYTGYTASGTCAGGWSGNDVSHNYATETTSSDGSEHYYVTNLKYTSTVNGKTYNGLASNVYTVIGGIEAEDNLAIVAKNYLNYTLPTPTALPDDDKVVIDYGLPVVIDLISNDYVLGNSWAITFGSYEGKYGTFVYNNDGTITYTLNKQLTGVEVIPYTLTATAIASDGSSYTDSNIGYVYIIPATTMYYEENFGSLVTYTGSGWDTDFTVESTYVSATQEPGVVGTVGDSPYGSDAAYLNDSHDSNGTSRHGDTTNSAIKFEYTFTGTGTSFYARTGNTTGYLYIQVANAAGTVVHSQFRDTYYDGSLTLYNIPVYTIDGLGYGTYTVTVMVGKESTDNGWHDEFWLDGIRVYNPLNSADDNYTVGTSAYATDAEANMTNVTLRDKLIGESDYNESGELVYSGGNFAVFTDTNANITKVEDYQSIGPKEEVYLNAGQSVTFSLTNWDPNSNWVYLGIKAPTGSGKVTIGTTELTINNAADCYYDISTLGTITTDTTTGVKTITFTIKAGSGSGSLISLTNIKVTGAAEFTIVTQADETVEDAEGGNG